MALTAERYYEIEDDLEGLTTKERHDYLQALPMDDYFDWLHGSPPETETERRYRQARETEMVVLTLAFFAFVIFIAVRSIFY